MKKAGPKTEKFQARFDDETRFGLELLASQTGKKLVRVVEDAIHAEADQLCKEQLGQKFALVYHEHPGVRMLNLLALPAYKPSVDEKDLRVFLEAHRAFFYTDDKGTIPNVGLVLTLWDKIEHYRELWRAERHENYWCAAEAMEAVLRKAKIKPPKYGHSK